MRRIIVVLLFILPLFITTRAYAENAYMNTEIIKQSYPNIVIIPPDVKYMDLYQELYKEVRYEEVEENESGSRYKKEDFSYNTLYGLSKLFYSK